MEVHQMKRLNQLVQKINAVFFRIITERQVQRLRDEVKVSYDRLFNLFMQGNARELQTEIAGTEKLLQAFRTTLETDEENIMYQMGLLGGATMVIKQMYFDNVQMEETHSSCPDTKYADRIVENLVYVPYMQHAQLARKLEISSSQLTQIMTKLDNSGYQFINSSREGKFKYYSLSEIGKKYYRKQIGRNFRNEIMQLLMTIYQRIRGEKRNTITDYICKYYNEDIDLKEAACRIEYALEKQEKRLNYLPPHSTQTSDIFTTNGTIVYAKPVNTVFKEREISAYCANNSTYANAFIQNMLRVAEPLQEVGFSKKHSDFLEEIYA